MVDDSARQAIKISSAGLIAEFRPDLGGRMTCLRRRPGIDIIVPLHDDVFAPLFWPKAGAYPLIPYHNRISNGRLPTRYGDVSLRPHPQALPHSLHGPAQCRPWSVRNCSENSVTMDIVYQPDEDWPWMFKASQTFEIEDDQLSIHLRLQNNDRSVMPAGLGWHPYFTGASEIRHDAAYQWPHRRDFLPEGHRFAISDRPDADIGKTAYLSGWSQAGIQISDRIVVTITASQVFQHLVLHQADDYSCIEAVSHVANGFNLAEQNTEGTGTCELRPGEALEGTITLHFEDRVPHDTDA